MSPNHSNPNSNHSDSDSEPDFSLAMPMTAPDMSTSPPRDHLQATTSWDNLAPYTGSSSSGSSSSGHHTQSTPLLPAIHSTYASFDLPPPPSYIPVPTSPPLSASSRSYPSSWASGSFPNSSEAAQAGSSVHSSWDTGDQQWWQGVCERFFGHWDQLQTLIFLCFACVVCFIAGVLIWAMVR